METKLRVRSAYTNVDTLGPMDLKSIKQMREAIAEQSISEFCSRNPRHGCSSK